MKEIELEPGLFASDLYCLYLQEQDAVVIADLHLGFEASLQQDGISVPHIQKGMVLEKLDKVYSRYSPRTMVVAGDFKNEFSKNLRQEWLEIEEVLDHMLDRSDVRILRGNHDNYLMTILARKGMELPYNIDIGRYTVMHGHKQMEPGKHGSNPLIIGHEHPSIRLRDEMGAIVKLPCFLYLEGQYVVLPSFSPLASGGDILSREGHYLSPMLGEELDSANVICLSELGLMDFGILANLKNNEIEMSAWRGM